MRGKPWNAARDALYVAALVAAALLCIGTWEPEYEVSYARHTVSEGQTLWGIATKHKPMQEKRMTMDEFVYNIREANRLYGDKFIHPGQVLAIPIYTEKK